MCYYTTTEYFESFSCWSFCCSLKNKLFLLHFVVSSKVAVEKLFCPPSAQWAYNHRSVCSCWTKWTEEYLKAYHWHCITQNSFCLCYAHLSHSWSTFGMAGWSFCQGRIGRDCVQPFSMFSLQVSGCFCGAEKQLSNSLEREVIASWWWDELTFAWTQRCLFPRLPSPPNTEAKSGVRVTEMHHLFLELIQYMGLWLWMSTTVFK